MERKYCTTKNNILKPKTKRTPQPCEKRTRVRVQICKPRPPCIIDIDGVRQFLKTEGETPLLYDLSDLKGSWGSHSVLQI